jgi:hypothetical protein
MDVRVGFGARGRPAAAAARQTSFPSLPGRVVQPGLAGWIVREPRRPYLKIDTQGYELEVLRGATTVLGAVVLVEAELSLLPTYEAGPLFEDVVAFLAEHRFSPIAFEGVLDDERTGEMLQVDAIFRST